MKAEVDVLGSPSLAVLMVSVDVKQHWVRIDHGHMTTWCTIRFCGKRQAVMSPSSDSLCTVGRVVMLQLSFFRPSSVILAIMTPRYDVCLTSLNCCMSTLCLVHYALLLTPACWKSNNTNVRLMAFAPSLALDPTFGIHSHKTLDTAQPCHLLKPNWKPSSFPNISILTNTSAQFLLQSLCVCVRARVCL